MEDVLTEIPPPSRFFREDLSNFTPPLPLLPSPFLVFSNPDNGKSLRPSLLLIAISSPSLYLFHHIPSKTLIGTLILPEIPFSGNTIEPSLNDRSCNIYSLNYHNDDSILLVSIQCSTAPQRSHSIAKLLIGEQICPSRVLILDSVQSMNFRGGLPPDEAFCLKLETSLERSSPLLNGLGYFPSGSLIDGLGAALLGRCEMRKTRGTLCVSWPEYGSSVLSLVKSVVLEDLFPGLELSREHERIKDRVSDSELYT